MEPVDRITIGAVGEPGERVFYLQSRLGGELVTIVVEKQQVQLLAATLVDVLAKLGEEVEELYDEAMELEEPLEPEWRAGRLAVGYEEERDLVLLELEELVAEGEEPDSIRLWGTREQMLALARRGAAVAAAGRPECRFCGNPIDPDGHVCPATNGHGGA